MPLTENYLQLNEHCVSPRSVISGHLRTLCYGTAINTSVFNELHLLSSQHYEGRPCVFSAWYVMHFLSRTTSCKQRREKHFPIAAKSVWVCLPCFQWDPSLCKIKPNKLESFPTLVSWRCTIQEFIWTFLLPLFLWYALWLMASVGAWRTEN